MKAAPRNESLRALLAPRRNDCGGLLVRVADEVCVLRCSGAMHVVAHDVLIVADLHFEKGSAYAARGQMLPPYDSAATLTRLEAEVAALNPRAVVLLGDSFHDRGAVPRMAAGDRARLERLAASRDWIWLEGNHDREALIPQTPSDKLPGEVVETLRLGTLRLVHEPEAGDQPGEVAGHLHPCVRVAAHGRGVRRACFITDGRRIILPAFGAFTGGLNVRDPAIAGLFASPPMAAALGRDRVHALAWETLS